jgi:hypothetical protein
MRWICAGFSEANLRLILHTSQFFASELFSVPHLGHVTDSIVDILPSSVIFGRRFATLGRVLPSSLEEKQVGE